MSWLSSSLCLVFLCSLSSCSQKTDAKLESETLENLYQAKLASISWEDGWPTKQDCDGTLWAGLACLSGVDVKLSLAEHSPGHLERRPERSCYPADSKSTISRDMLTGYIGCAYKKKDLAALERLADYGEGHNWQMGEPASAVGDVYLDTNLQGILARFAMALGGRERANWRSEFVPVPVTPDYARHVQMIQIYLHGLEHGSITALAMEVLKNNVRSDEDDAFFQALKGRYTGDFDKFTELVSNPNYTYPSYVRGAEQYKDVHLLFALAVALGK